MWWFWEQELATALILYFLGLLPMLLMWLVLDVAIHWVKSQL